MVYGVLILRPKAHTAHMNSSGRVEKDPVPVAIQSAEQWRQIGERLRVASPKMYEQLFMLLVASCVPDDDFITESYFIT